MIKRVFLIVLDSLGIGAAPDAHEFSDVAPSTLRRISRSKSFNIPNLLSLGIANIDGVDYLEGVAAPLAERARLMELSRGKDTTTGHFELAGIISREPMPTYPLGFPDEIIDAFSRATGRGVLCNKPYSGTAVIGDYGDEHIKTGDLIVYTSADSVFQIAAHEDTVPPEQLYEYCKIARGILTGKHAVGRVIARPFVGESGNYTRTANRRDFSLVPPRRTMLDAIRESGLSTVAVGKIHDIFAGAGITESILTHGNREGMEVTEALLKRDFSGLCFVNLVDFDMLYGHRQDTDGYAAALSEFDGWLGSFINKLGDEDALIITADHGCDPGDDSTDHTREYVPYLLYSKTVLARDLGTKRGFGFVAERVCELLSVEFSGDTYDR